MHRKKAADADTVKESKRDQLKPLLEKLAHNREDETLVQDYLLQFDKMRKVIDEINALSTEDLVLPEDWIDRSAEERQRYIHAQSVINAGRDYADGGWLALTNAVDVATRTRQHIQEILEDTQEARLSEERIKSERLRREVADMEAQIKDLELRRDELLRTEKDGKELYVTKREIHSIDSLIANGQTILQISKNTLVAYGDPERKELLFSTTDAVLQLYREELRLVDKKRARAKTNRHIRSMVRSALVICVAITIFILGKFSETLGGWLAVLAAIALWAVDHYCLEPILQRLALRRLRDGLTSDIGEIYRLKGKLRIQQSEYNERLRAAGLDEVTIAGTLGMTNTPIALVAATG
jgi:hypothetical protein